jgi:hypothetical protein
MAPMSTSKLKEAEERAKRSERRDQLDQVADKLCELLGLDPDNQDIMVDPSDGYINIRLRHAERIAKALDTATGRVALRSKS